MRMQFATYVAVAMACSGGTNAQAVAEKPTRSECIAGFTLDWSRVSTDRGDVLNSIADVPPDRGAERPAAMAVSRDRSRFYFQYASRCPEKWDLAERLIASWKGRGIDLPDFIRIGERILPSPATIDARGPSWRD